MLLLIPALLFIHYINVFRKNRKLNKAGDIKLIKGLVPELSSFRSGIKFYLMLFSYTLIVLIISRPQFGSKIEETKREGVEIIIALDVSNSMLAEDIQPDRLERAKQSISRLVDRLENLIVPHPTPHSSV